MSKVKAINWKHLAKRGWQLALLLIVPGGSIVVLALWWLELSREVPFKSILDPRAHGDRNPSPQQTQMLSPCRSGGYPCA